MPTGVLTSYKVNSNLYSSYILGSDMVSITKAVKKRGLNETVKSQIMDIEDLIPDYSILSNKEFEKRIPEIIHTACFLSYMVIKSKNMIVEDVLGDEGVVHEISHYLYFRKENKKSLNDIRDLVINLQRKTIGIYEPV